jgi:AcrR family transcriptional regulator
MARPASDIAPRILHAARDRFLHEGVDGASLRNIAKDAGTNIGMVYYYFKTKDDLFLAVVEETYGKVLEDLKHALARDISPEQRIERLYQRVAALSEDEFKIIRLILREALVSSTRLGRVARRFQEGHIPLVIQLVQDGAREGTLRADLHPVALVAPMFLLGLMPQLMRRLLAETDLPFAQLLPSPSSVAATMLKVLLSGIASPTAATPAADGGSVSGM